MFNSCIKKNIVAVKNDYYNKIITIWNANIPKKMCWRLFEKSLSSWLWCEMWPGHVAVTLWPLS